MINANEAREMTVATKQNIRENYKKKIEKYSKKIEKLIKEACGQGRYRCSLRVEWIDDEVIDVIQEDLKKLGYNTMRTQSCGMFEVSEEFLDASWEESLDKI